MRKVVHPYGINVIICSGKSFVPIVLLFSRHIQEALALQIQSFRTMFEFVCTLGDRV